MPVYRLPSPSALALVPLCFLLSPVALAQGATPVQPQSLRDCTPLGDDLQRLACFDRLAAGAPLASVAPAEQEPADDPVEMPASQSAFIAPSSNELEQIAAATGQSPVAPVVAPHTLSSHWELESGDKRGLFKFRPHNPNYLMVTRTHEPNEGPYQNFLGPLGVGLSKSELEFQLSFKMKAAENLFNTPVDLWFGYTQNSFWQAANREASSPFRETNYQPEVMAVIPLNYRVLGMDVRFLNLGLSHQSNGQSSTLSRSWNRYYVQMGMERGPVSVTGKLWKRVNESAEDDNNPDIIDYMGRFELAANWRLKNGHELSGMMRRNFHTDKSALQLGWSFPLVGALKGYVNWFSGYGQSMIDYNYFQRSVGLGVVVKY